MVSNAFDAFTRHFTRQQRLSASVTSEDGNRNKKQNKQNGGSGKKVFARCKAQVTACDAFVQKNCADAACRAAVTVCCESLGVCDFTGFIACVNDATAP